MNNILFPSMRPKPVEMRMINNPFLSKNGSQGFRGKTYKKLTSSNTKLLRHFATSTSISIGNRNIQPIKVTAQKNSFCNQSKLMSSVSFNKLTATDSENVISILAQNLSPILLKPHSLKFIQSKIKDFHLVSNGIFECRFCEKNPFTDFAFCFTKQEKFQFIGKKDLKTFPHVGIESFFKNWEITKNYDPIEAAWLEFDTLETIDEIRHPSILFKIDESRQDLTSIKDLIVPLFEEIHGKPIDPDTLQKILSSLQLMPENVIVRYIGFMLSRNIEAIRFILRYIKFEHLFGFLNTIGWRENETELKGILYHLKDSVDSLALSLDIGKEIHPRIGIECFIDTNPLSGDPWKGFFNKMISLNLCSEEERVSTLLWPGYDSPKENWPPSLEQTSNVLARRISHIKIIYSPNSKLSAKAYLHFFSAKIEDPPS